MSYAMTHLIIANEIANRLNITNKDIFMLANIAPDTVHSRADFTTRLKANAHFLQPNENWGEIYKEESMVIWYDRLRDIYSDKLKLVNNEKELAFLQGYTLHMLVDVFNCKLLYAKNLIAYNFDVEAMRGEYRRQCIIQDNYLYQNCQDNQAIMEALRRALESDISDEMLVHLGYSQFISVENIRDNIDFIMKGFREAKAADMEGLSMVSVEASKEFLKKVTDEAERILYDFPPVGDTFSME